MSYRAPSASSVPVLAAAPLALLAVAAFGSPVQEEPAAEPVTLELEALDGTLRRIPAGEPTLSDPRSEGAWIVRVLGVRQEAPEPPAPEADGRVAEVHLADGDRLRGFVAGGDGETLELRLAGGALLPLTIDALRSVVVPANVPASSTTPLEAPDEGDRVYARTGDSLDRDDGALIGFDEEGVRFESTLLGERTVPWSDLAALFVEVFGDGAGEAEGEGVAVSVDLVDGGRLGGRLLRLDAQRATLRVGGATELALPLARVVAVTVQDGRLRYLSSLDAVEEIGRGAPFGDELGLTFDHVPDRAVTGGPLVVGGRRYARGLGMHAPSTLRYELPEGWTALRGKVGVDDSTARLPESARGSVVFRVRWNDELLWESPVVHGGKGAVALPTLTLSEGGGRRLELEVDPVEDFRGDRADWLELVLLR